jgi:hypothetical protein
MISLVTAALLIQGPLAMRTEPVARVSDPDIEVALSHGSAGLQLSVRQRAGYLVVLHVDPDGNIRVLYPARPSLQQRSSGVRAFQVSLTADGAAQAIANSGPGTVLAARSDFPFHFDGLASSGGDRWDYDSALLLQPTAGNAMVALLDVVDRMADGHAYQYDAAAYGAHGIGFTRPRAVPNPVCFECLAARHPARYDQPYDPPPVVPQIAQAGVVSTLNASVNCSAAYLVNSFCGVQDNRVVNVIQQQNDSYSDASYPVYAPRYFPRFLPRQAPRPMMAPMGRTIALPQARAEVFRGIPPAHR